MKDKMWFTPVRFSHLTRHAAVGAVVRDQNDWLMVVKDISTWPERDMLQLHAVERVKQHLSVSGRLLLPPIADIDEDANLKIRGGTIPTVRFPSWAKCQSCNLLCFKPWHKQSSKISNDMVCPDCLAGKLEQVTWCAVSSFGGITDVPWHYFCHVNSKSECRVEKGGNYLKLVVDDKGRSKVECKKCGSRGFFERADFQRKEHLQVGIKLDKSINDKPIIYSVMEVNDPRVFNAMSERAVVIPPESNIDRNSLVYRLQQHSQMVSDIKNATRGLQRRREIKKAMRKFQCIEEDLLTALDTIDRGKQEQTFLDKILVGDMLSDEYEALTTPQEFNNDADFITRHLSSEWFNYIDKKITSSELKYIASLVDRLVAVDRLRVIEVFKGFQRAASDYDQIDPKVTQSPDFSGKLDWLPAIELFGEGVFFTLDCQKLEQWESNTELRRRAQEIKTRFNNSTINLSDDASPTPRFIMLHTLSHILIREFESLAGYPASSLQERIYCSTSGGMAGILIYTAVPDIAGSLGGIVELANPAKFIRLLDAAIRQAEWCSLDPVCGEMEGQGPSWLNRAACHGCALVPDTSCSYNNVFLDRVFIKGKLENGIPALIDVMR
ncbi:MAG: DUF1998 domain-containing protein [Hahellaceae bacterium]|nr:DUF1998 domain-containing protein [Hahellaceae bacterium]MCP5210017.1 DUF1998 domain-containing protein [Hahellaceae bacterium]